MKRLCRGRVEVRNKIRSWDKKYDEFELPEKNFGFYDIFAEKKSIESHSRGFKIWMKPSKT